MVERSGFRVIYNINLLALTEGLLLALYLKHAQVSNNAKKLRGQRDSLKLLFKPIGSVASGF